MAAPQGRHGRYLADSHCERKSVHRSADRPFGDNVNASDPLPQNAFPFLAPAESAVPNRND
jgi:hypothetical protein